MWKYGTVALAALLCAAPLSAQVIRLEISSREPMNTGQPAGAAGPFELIRGRIHGEVDPKDPHNAIIQDLGMAPRNPRGNVEYVATFALAKPVDLAKASHVLVYQVVNRGNGQATANAEGDIALVSGWQGDVIPTTTNQTLVVPVARKKDGSPVTGRVIARLFDLPDDAHSAPIRLASLGTAQPYLPADLAQLDATLTWHSSENYAGQQDARHTVPRAAWAFANCQDRPWPGTPDPSRICVKDAFRAGRLYELVYTAKDPLVAKSKAERISNKDPRLSIEERYGTHLGYVVAVRKAADQAVKDRFLLPDDAARYARAAEASKVLEETQPAPSAASAFQAGAREAGRALHATNAEAREQVDRFPFPFDQKRQGLAAAADVRMAVLFYDLVGGLGVLGQW